MSASIKIRFVNCDPATRTRTSFMSLLVSTAVGCPVEIVVSQRQRVDLQFTSVQIPIHDRIIELQERVLKGLRIGIGTRKDHRWSRHNPSPQGNARAHVWYTGENLRPPCDDWDGYLSFDLDPLDGKNVYLPLWWHTIGLLGPPHSPFMEPSPRLESLLTTRSLESLPPKFAVAFINNPEPTRLHALDALREHGVVDVFGHAIGRPIANKAQLAGQYQFCVCFENDVYPGYVTEKPIEAWSLGAIPLWRGLDPAGYLNGDAMLNAVEVDSLSELAQRAAAISRDARAWRAMAERPLLTRAPNLEAALDLIRALA